MPSKVPCATPLIVTFVPVPPDTTTVAGSGDVFVTGVVDAGTLGVLKAAPWSSVAPFVAVVSVRRPAVSMTPHSRP